MCEIGWQMTNSAHSDRVAATATRKQKGIYRAKEGKNRQRQPTMQSFIKMCCVFKLGAVYSHLQQSSVLSHLGFNMTLISTNTKASVSD